MLRIFWCFCVRLFQPFPLRDGSIYFGTAPWYFLSRYTSGFPEMLISLTPNGLIVFCHVLLTYPYRPAGESLVLQTWRMSEPFAPDPLDEKIVSLPAEIQGEPLHIISLMTRLPENNFGPLALLNVYAAGTDMVTRVPVERFDIDLYYMADKHGALGMGLSYTSHGAFCAENQVYHFDNVFFKIGSCIFYCLVSTVLAWRAQRVIASFSSSELSSHQIPRSIGSEGPLQLKGCTRTSCLFSPTTPSGASVLSALFSHLALHFDFGVEQACSAAARVLLASPSRASPSSASSRSAFLPYEAFPHAEERRLRICASCGSALPSSGPTSSFLSSSMRVEYLLGGGRTCFPDRDCRCRPVSCSILLRSCSLVLRSLFLPGRPDVFSWPRLRTTSSPLLHSSILLISTRSSCASMVWSDTVFGVPGRGLRVTSRGQLFTGWFMGVERFPG